MTAVNAFLSICPNIFTQELHEKKHVQIKSQLMKLFISGRSDKIFYLILVLFYLYVNTNPWTSFVRQSIITKSISLNSSKMIFGETIIIPSARRYIGDNKVMFPE